ncbi:MAG TPA: hypothetical protein DD412_06520 [Holosporales bacterium]|nr:hypothetical protein [Holosporales bacterium]
MNTLTTLTVAAFTILSLNGTTFAGKIHTLDDICAAEREAKKLAALERRLIQTDPSLLRKIKKEQVAQEESKKFPGKGHKVGGDKYVNRLLGINHKEGKRLAKLAKKSPKQTRHLLFHAKAPLDEVIIKPIALTVISEASRS